MSDTPEEHKLEITTQIVTTLIAEQFPQFAHLQIKPVDHGGNDNRTFRLGNEMSIRLPSAEEYVSQVQKEQKWLPKIASHLPLPIPQPIAMGVPSVDYPWNWSIYKWLEGKSANSLEHSDADLETIAMQLAQFLSDFHKLNTAGAPAPGLHNWWRAAHTSIYDAETRFLIDKLKGFINADDSRSLWQRALNSKWDRDPVWVHGDVASGNLLVKENRLSAVIDFGCMGIGDPACDLTIAWTFFRGKSRGIFKENLHLDEETWARARGWAMWKALYTISELENKSGTALAKQQQIIDAVMMEHCGYSRI
ncbi:MAG: aminoglycoside phosphotransferase family protein [Gammaproteobacteria bacterium]|nr:aminoglycoside phosphotransferase family protein [Gammaproteobacteria bacterium]